MGGSHLDVDGLCTLQQQQQQQDHGSPQLASRHGSDSHLTPLGSSFLCCPPGCYLPPGQQPLIGQGPELWSLINCLTGVGLTEVWLFDKFKVGSQEGGGGYEGESRECGNMVCQGHVRNRVLWDDLGPLHFPFSPPHLGGGEGGKSREHHQVK